MKWLSAGDNGDIVYAMAICHALGGTHTLLLEDSKVTKGYQNMVPCIPLVLAQPYIEDCRKWDGAEPVDWNSGGFRGAGMHSMENTLIHAHLSHFNSIASSRLRVRGEKPWLFVNKSEESSGRVVVNRTFRYRNHEMPWRQIVDFYGDKTLFIGAPNEHEDFCNQFGRVDYHPTKDLLEAAQIIAGSLLFIGNQSVCGAIAHGLGHPLISEVALHIPDCIYKRDNAQYCYNGAVTLLGLGKEDLVIPRPSRTIHNLSVNVSPPGRWRFPGLPFPCADTIQARREMKKLPEWRGKTDEEMLAALLEHTLQRVPDWQQPKQQYHRVQMALMNAGYQL